MRRRARRLGIAARKRVAALPQDDGLVPVLVADQTKFGRRVFWAKVTPTEVHDWAAEKMATHDARSADLRWGGNQWGEQWVEEPQLRRQFAKRMPLLATDLSLDQWWRALRAIYA